MKGVQHLCRLRSILLLSALCSADAFADTFLQVSLSAGDEANVNRGLDSLNIIDSSFLSVQLDGGKFYPVGPAGTVTLFGSVAIDSFQNAHGFDVFSAGLGISYSHQFGLGPYTPNVEMSFMVHNEELQKRGRDRLHYLSNMIVSRRFSPAISGFVGLEYMESTAEGLDSVTINYPAGVDLSRPKSFSLYDFDATTLSVGFDYDLNNIVMMSLSYNMIDGATVASTQQAGLLVYNLSRAFYRDDAIGGTQVAYQLETITDDWTVNLSYPLGRDTSLDIGYSWQSIEGPRQFDYDNKSLRLTFTHRL